MNGVLGFYYKIKNTNDIRNKFKILIFIEFKELKITSYTKF